MKLTVKTLKGSHFEIKVQPTDTVMAVKKSIEDVQGKDNYPCGQQLLIHNGKVLKDQSTLVENKVSEDGFLVVMLSKSKTSGASGSSSAQPASAAPLQSSLLPVSATQPQSSLPLASAAQPQSSLTPASAAQPQSSLTPASESLNQAMDTSDTYAQAASNLVAGTNLEPIIQQIMDMGGGSWDKETVTRALRAAYNNPERAVDYLYSGIPETAEVAVQVPQFPTSQVASEGTGIGEDANAPASGAPNSSPLNLFPQEATHGGGSGALGSLDFLRNSQQFQALRSMVQSNPQILQPMLQELGKQNPQLLRLIQEHNAEFLQLINEPLEGSEGDIFDQPEQEDMPHAISVTPAEQEAISRLEAMGFERGLVIEAFFACDRNEELAINYLLEHAGDYED